MKVVIACLNSKYVHASLSPWCLLAGVREFAKNAYDTLVMESTINGDGESFAQKIINEKPDVVAFSCYIWNISKTLEVCRIIKSNHECKIVLGGPEVEYRPKDVLEKYDFADFVLSGEGEWTFLLAPKLEPNGTDLVPVYPEEPFAYIARLKKAYLVKQNRKIGIVIQ